MKRRNLLAAILAVLWLLGLVTFHTLGGFLHILLAVAIAVVLFNIISRSTKKGETQVLEFPDFLR